MPQRCLTDLPPELLDHITTFLPTANSLANLGRTNKDLHTFVERDAWQTFARLHFPSLCPADATSYKDAARTLTSLSRAWDHRAFVARHIEPRGDITAHPGGHKINQWKKPKGQTIGFTPHLDVYEEDIGSKSKKEVLAYSAGAEICLRTTQWSAGNHKHGKEQVRWQTYRPHASYEGRDDVTTLHLLRSASTKENPMREVITGTANGDLQLLGIPQTEKTEVDKAYFTTQGQAVRTSSLLERHGQTPLLAVGLGDANVCLYNVDRSQPKIAPYSQVDIKGQAQNNRESLSKAYRAWSTQFLSKRQLAVGLGPSEEPLHVYAVTPTGISTDHARKFELQSIDDLDDRTDEIAPGGVARKPMSSVYPTAPLPDPSISAGHSGSDIFLSGAYDGIVRLHDLRSARDVEGMYADPTDDSAVYSLLPRGMETVLVGSNRHNLVKVFDLRMGAKCYSYLDAQEPQHDGAIDHVSRTATSRDWCLFLKPHSGSANNDTRSGWASRRSAESSIYTLASASHDSPNVYAGIENQVVQMAFTDVLDPDPDPIYFQPWKVPPKLKREVEWNGWKAKDIIDLACYDQNAGMKLYAQRSLPETWVSRNDELADAVPWLDRRWKIGGS